MASNNQQSESSASSGGVKTSAFEGTIDAWVRKSEARMLAVFRESARRTISIAQRLIPVDSGYARASIRVSTQSMPPTESGTRRAADKSYSYDSGVVDLVILGAQLGDQLFCAWTANYAIHLERGHSKQAPNGFVRLAALAWPNTVSQVVADAKARVRSG